MLDGVSVDTNGQAFWVGNIRSNSPLVMSHFACFVWGTLGGGTVTLQVSPDNGLNWFTARRTDENQAIFTIPDLYMIALPIELHVRAKLTGSAGASGVSVELL